MKVTSFPKKIGYFLVTGLLIISFTLFLGQFTTLHDFAKGALMGVGIGMELIALNRFIAYNKKMRTTENR